MEYIDLYKRISEGERVSFHVFSEIIFRGEIKKEAAGTMTKDYKLTGNLLIIVLEGKIDFIVNKQNVYLKQYTEILITENEIFSYIVKKDCVMHWIWGQGLYNLDK
jgi:hypothetical protein